jgi:hypothetical protein
LTNSRVWANVPPPFRAETVISLPNDRRVNTASDGGFGAPRRMSTNNRNLLMIGLTVLTSLGWATARDRVDADEPISQDTSAAAPALPERYLLLTNGQLIQGIVSQEGPEYLVAQRVGTMRFPKKRVEGAFGSVREAYQYRLEQLPERDSDERMKLALWCLHLKLTAEAREQLNKVLELNPNHAQAKAMSVSIEQAATRAVMRQRDPQVRQTRAPEMNGESPGTLDSAMVRRAQHGLGISDQPVIFDLPTPIALKRADEFARYVHPLLQSYCANCHDGQYQGSFQLVPMKSRADRIPGGLRANLDATLRLIDPKNPSHSELLSSTLRPHGTRGLRPRPIFPGSNDPTYKILATWVNNLCPPKNNDDAARAERGGSRTEPGETFAAERDSVGQERPDRGAPALPAVRGRAPLSAGMPAETKIPPPSPSAAGRGGSMPMSRNPADPEEFPLPFAITGVRPNLPTSDARPKAGSKASSPKPAADASSKAQALAGATTAAAGGPVKPVPPTDADKSADQATGKDGSGAPKKTKPLTLDPKLLERALQSRNAGRSGP